MRRPPRLILAAVLALGLLSLAAPALAQAARPLPAVTLDVRGVLARLGQDTATATDLAIPVDDLPTRATGVALHLNVYPVRRVGLSFGASGDALLSRARLQKVDADGLPVGAPIERRLQGLGGSASLNFGDLDGWSYVSGGLMWMRFESFVGALPPEESQPLKATQHVGGGARWFTTDHVAFTFDVRFYFMRPEAALGPLPSRLRKRLMVLSAGISIK